MPLLLLVGALGVVKLLTDHMDSDNRTEYLVKEAQARAKRKN
jgi:hypothetical protein